MKKEDTEKTIRVKMKIGEVEFEVECQEEQLQTTIDKILSTVTKRLKETQLVIERTKPSRNYAETCKGVIIRLWEERFFLEPRKLGQIHNEMARRGISKEKLDEIFSIIYTELLGKPQMKVDELAALCELNREHIERILVHLIHEGNINGFIEANVFYIEEV